MTCDPPRPHHDAIRRGREEARNPRESVGAILLGVSVRHGAICVPLLVLGYRAWRDGRDWLGIVVFAGGMLLVIGFFVVREFLRWRHQAELVEGIRTRRALRRLRRDGGSGT